MTGSLNARVKAAQKILDKKRGKSKKFVVFLDGLTTLPDGRKVTKDEYYRLHPAEKDEYTIEVKFTGDEGEK